MPEVSVIIPTHNRSQLVALCLRSVLWQRQVDFEVIVVDDGSADDTQPMLASFGDPRVRVLRHERAQGVSAARNHGIAEAHGEWVAFLDDDDLWAPDKLALQVEALRKDGRRWAYAGAVDISLDNMILAGRPPAPPDSVVEGLTTRNMLPAGSSNVIVGKRWLPTPTVFDGSLYHSADWDLWIRLAKGGPPAWVPKPLVGYRIHPGSASLDLEGMFAESYEIERRYGGHVDRTELNRYLAKFAKRAGWRKKALEYYWRAALVGNPGYIAREFVPDISTLLFDMLRTRTGRVSVRRQDRFSGTDPHASWKEEARVWVDCLARSDDRAAEGSPRGA
jgi:glycosyltransferase involved in cell wall biosynthesis